MCQFSYRVAASRSLREPACRNLQVMPWFLRKAGHIQTDKLDTAKARACSVRGVTSPVVDTVVAEVYPLCDDAGP